MYNKIAIENIDTSNRTQINFLLTTENLQQFTVRRRQQNLQINEDADAVKNNNDN